MDGERNWENGHTGGGVSRESRFGPFTRRVMVAVGIAVAVVVVLLLLRSVAGVLLVIFGGVLLAVVLNGLAKRLDRYTLLPYGASLALVVVLLFGLLGLAVWLLAPQVAAEMDRLAQTLPESMDRIEESLSQYSWGEFLLEQTPAPSDVVGGDGGFVSRATGILSTGVGILANVVLIIALGIYLAVNPDSYKRGFVKLVPISKRPRAREVLDDTGGALWGWLTGQAVSMAIIGVLTWLGLTLLGVPLALALGVIAGLLEFVPLIGPWVSAVPALLIAFVEGPTQALYVALLYLGIQQVESNVITPVVMKKAVELPPALTLSATVLAGALLGLPGILLATPLAVVVKVLVQRLYIEDVLGDRDHDGEHAG